MIDSLLIWFDAHRTAAFWMAGLSLLTFAGSLLILPFLVTWLPADYFSEPRRRIGRLHRLHPLLYYSLRIVKNLLGWLLVLAGLAMLVLPGQGLLTILVGLVLSDFPGKYALERRLADNPRVLAAMNWLRARRGHPPLLPPEPDRAPVRKPTA